ncbi:MAG: Crp/Fnr family transcriptional regulator [Cyclobacteriaceae bacterium]
MDPIEIKTFLSGIHPVKDTTLDAYISHWRDHQTPKKTIMTSPGETERYIYYVQEGIQKSYYHNGDKQHIIAFAYAPSFSGIPESFFTQTPSRYFLETISDSQFLRISHGKHQQLMEEYREIETLFRKATEQFLDGFIQRHHELMAFDIETRFKNFAKRSPHLLGLISQKDLASYLRIESSNFSKLMNSMRI